MIVGISYIYMNDKLEYLWKVYNAIDESIKFSNSKAATSLAINGILISLVLSQIINTKCFLDRSPVLTFLFILFFLSTLSSIILCSLCLMPSSSIEKSDSIIYFERIAKDFKSNEDYLNKAKMILSDDEESLKQLTIQIRQLSKVASYKFEFIKWGVFSFSITIFMLLIILCCYTFSN